MTIPVTRDLACLRVAIVNVFFYGAPDAGDRGWVLIDAGLHGSAHRIVRAAAERYGADARPSAIVLTHGHFDHVGALEALAERWDVPVFAHLLELPYLTGRESYPPPDPTVGGGAMARLSPLYPRGPVDVSDRVRALPLDGSVPEMPGWRWLHTPGHAPGHVSLWREVDGVLVAGDAVVTTKQESMLAALTQRVELHGPPMYFTQDWTRARQSVELLAELEPAVLATGHGRPIAGPQVADGLRLLARDFRLLAMPDHGRYVNAPARFDAGGVVTVPPPVSDNFPKIALAVGALAVTGIALALMRRGDGRAAALQADEAAHASLDELAIADVGSAFEDHQHVPVAGGGVGSAPVAQRALTDGRWTEGAGAGATGRPFDYGSDASAPGDVPGGP